MRPDRPKKKSLRRRQRGQAMLEYSILNWVLVIVIAFLGVAKPGAELDNKPTAKGTTTISAPSDPAESRSA